ncbi:MAG: dihydrofolate reductase family protein [Paramuribaculum sp.]|nr:dihydrofolate reductase family protein [Paramuribaculum sp.]
MSRPYIICHMVESIDGRIDCGMVDKISGDEYYTTLNSLDCKASVEGRITMEHYYALPEKFVAKDKTPLGKKEVFKSTGRNDFHICPDTKGTLQWDSATMEDGRPLLVLTSESTPAEYISYLRSKGISYIATGKGNINLVNAMDTLGSEFGVKRLAVLGGGLINGGFLAAGLIDEVSLLLAPGIDGREGWRAMFDGILDQTKMPTKLKLQSVERLENDILWIKYELDK